MMQEQPVEDLHGTTSPARPGFARRNALLVAVAALLAIIVVVIGLTWGSQRGALNAQQARISTLEDQLTNTETKKSEQVDQNLLESLGVSQGRIGADALVIGRLVKTVFTWDSGRAYESARTDLKERYGLSEDEPFLQQFMPPSRFNEDSSGKRYYYIDTQGLNSALSDAPDCEVVKVSAGQYTYAVLVEVAITSDAVAQNQASPDRVTAHRRMLLFLTTNADGDVSGLSGIPTSGSSRHSG